METPTSNHPRFPVHFQGFVHLQGFWGNAWRTPAERVRILHWPTPEAAEWFSIRTGAWWCLLLTPTVHLFPTNPLFAGLARVAPESAWLLVMGCLIGAQALAFLWGRCGLRAALLFLVGVIWGAVAGLTWGAAPHCPLWPFPHSQWLPKTTGVGVYGALAADCLWAGIHLTKRTYWDWLVRAERPSGRPGTASARHPGPSGR